MITLNEVEEICNRISLENGTVPEKNAGKDISCIVYRADVFACGETSIMDRHIDMEYSFGEYYEIQEHSSVFQFIRTLCGLPLLQEKKEIVVYRRDRLDEPECEYAGH